MTAHNWQRYSYAIDPDADDTPNKVLRLVGAPKRVLELGCAMGTMTQILQARGCAVTAIEIDAELAERARPFCDRLIVGDLEQLDLAACLGDDPFDVMIAADVLEHLKDPERCLNALRPFLKSDGFWVISVPNAAHSALVAQLLAGRFPYQEKGLLDFTHLRFFTRQDLDGLLLRTGYLPERWERHRVAPQHTELSHHWLALPEVLRQNLAAFPEADTYQFIVRAFNSTEAGRTVQLQTQNQQWQTEYADLERAHEALKTRFAETDASLREHQKAFNEARTVIARFEQEAATLREEVAHCGRLPEEYAALQTRFAETDANLREHQKAFSEARTAIARLEQEVAHYGRLSDEHAALQRRFVETDADLREHQKAFNEAREIIARFERDIAALQAENQNLRQQIDAYEATLIQAQDALDHANQQQTEVQLVLQAQNQVIHDTRLRLESMQQNHFQTLEQCATLTRERDYLASRWIVRQTDRLKRLLGLPVATTPPGS